MFLLAYVDLLDDGRWRDLDEVALLLRRTSPEVTVVANCGAGSGRRLQKLGNFDHALNGQAFDGKEAVILGRRSTIALVSSDRGGWDVRLDRSRISIRVGSGIDLPLLTQPDRCSVVAGRFRDDLNARGTQDDLLLAGYHDCRCVASRTLRGPRMTGIVAKGLGVFGGGAYSLASDAASVYWARLGTCRLDGRSLPPEGATGPSHT